MKNCVQCSNKIANDARTCPHCGTHSPHRMLWGDPRFLTGLAVILFILFACSAGS